MSTIQLTKEEFKKKIMDFENNPSVWVYEGDKPSIIDFYADWCGPCKQTAPILNEISNDYKDKINVYKVDVDQEEELAALFGVQSIPTIVFIPTSGLPQKSVGAMMKSQFINVINDILLK